MEKARRLLILLAAKGLLLTLVSGLFPGACPSSLARNDDPDLLKEQILKFYQQRNYQEAIPIAEKLLAIRKRMLGPEHPNTAVSLCDLALLYQYMGAYAKAEPLYQQALQIRQKALGREHSETAISLRPVGGSLSRNGRLRSG